MRSFDSIQQGIVDSDRKTEISWLFDIDTDNDGTPDYRYSTKARSYGGNSYTAKVVSFTPITMRRNASEASLVAPSKITITLSNSGNSLNASSFDGAEIKVRLVVNDGDSETELASWSFDVIGYSGVYQKITLTCRDWLQKYLEGDYPNTSYVQDLFVSDDPSGERAICVPKVFGTPYIPIGSAYITNRRYYVLGPQSESLGSEKLSNVGFESAGGGGADVWASWTESAGDGALADEGTIVHGGSHAAKLTAGASANTNINQTYAATAGKLHKISFWTRGDGSNALRYWVWDNTNSALLIGVTDCGVTGTTYTQVTNYFTVPYNCTSVKVYFHCPTANGGIAYLDDVSVKQDDQFSITKVRSPRQWSSKSEWTSASYKFEYYRKQGTDGNYYTCCRYIIADSDANGTADDNGLFRNGEQFLPVPTKFTDVNTSSYTSPGDWINQILLDMGIPSSYIDSTSLTAVKSTYSTWGLTFNGGIWYKINRKKLLAKLLAMCHTELIVRDKIYFKVHSKTSQFTVTKAYVMRQKERGEGSFTVSSVLTNDRKDSGYGAYQEADEPIDELIKILVPAKTTTNNISGSTVACDYIQDDQDAQAIAQLGLQRLLLGFQKVGFTGNGQTFGLEVDDVITINHNDYGGEGSTYPVLINEVKINKDLSIQYSCTRFSAALDDFSDLSPSAVTVASDDTTSIYEPVVAGPETTLSSSKPNSVTKTIYVGDDSNHIVISGDYAERSDRIIAIGKSDFTNTDNGFIIGIDHSDSDKTKFYLGSSTDYLNWDGSGFVLNVTSANAIVIKSGADIKLEAAASNPGKLVFSGSSNDIELGTWTADGRVMLFLPDTNDVCDFWIGENTFSSGQWFEYIYLMSSKKTWLYSITDTDNNANIEIYNVEDTSSLIRMEITIVDSGSFLFGIDFYLDGSNLYFSPDVNKAIDLGQSATAWDDAYADDWNNVADFFHLDVKDDLAELRRIKGSGNVDDRTGLELIDDSTLPKWLLTKHKKTGEILYDPDGKPYIALKTIISLLMGCCRQLDGKMQRIEEQLKQ